MNTRRVTKISVLAIAFLWAGYSITSNAQALGSKPVSALQSQSTVNDAQNQEDAYPGLPKGVTHSVQSVVAVQRITSSNSWSNAIVASGVILNDHTVLTAGHTAENNGVLSCVDTTVNAPGFLTAATASGNSVTYASAMHSESTDLAVMTVNADQNYKSLPVMSVASQLPKDGEVVYFINYQPLADGTIRDPLSRTNSDPVIFSGVVIGHNGRGLQIAAGGGISYGHGTAETLLRKGASGGAIVNSDGQLVGLSVSSDSLDANRTPQYIGTNYGVSLPNGRYQVVNAQTLDMQLLTKLQSSLSACK